MAVIYLCGALATVDPCAGKDIVRLDLCVWRVLDLADSPKATRFRFCDTTSAPEPFISVVVPVGRAGEFCDV